MSLLLNLLAVLSAGLTAFLYWLGLEKFFFWYYPRFDILIHLVGGLTIGLWGSALAWQRGYSRSQAFLFILLLAIAVGSVWEIFEYLSGLTQGEAGYWFDTIKDLSDNIIGALIGWGFYSLLPSKKSEVQ